LGANTIAPSGYETAIGRYNTKYTIGSKLGWSETDRLFVIGNGVADDQRSNALVILKNGNTGIGVTNPTAKLDIDGQLKIRGGSPGAGKVLTSDATGLAYWQNPTGGGLTLPYSGTISSEEAALKITNSSSTAIIGEATGTSVYNEGILGVSNSTKGVGVVGYNSALSGITFGTIGQVKSPTGFSGFFDGGKFYVSGNVGIGNQYPAYKLDVKGNSRIQLTKTTGQWIAMRTDGDFLDFSFSGHNLVIKSENNGENILLNPASTNKVGIRTWTPQYDLDVNGNMRVAGSSILGSSGKAILEIREITGTTYPDVGLKSVSYPSGYSMSNTRILSAEINYGGDSWMGLSGSHNNINATSRVYYVMNSDAIWIYYPDNFLFQNRAFRIMIMKVQ
jgi:hypothetical protein